MTEMESDVSELLRRGIELVSDGFALFRIDGTILHVNPALAARLGFTVPELLERNAIMMMHPDDLERAMVTLAETQSGFRPDESTEVRLLHSDGTWRNFDVGVGVLTDAEGGIDCLSGIFRPADNQVTYRSSLRQLLNHEPAGQVLRSLHQFVDGDNDQSKCGVAWVDEPETEIVTEGSIPLILAGQNRFVSPWKEVHETGEEVVIDSLEGLDAAVVAAAERAGVGQCWVAPVLHEGRVCATVSIWTAPDGPSPRIWVRSMTTVTGMAELVVAFEQQNRRIAFQASHDALTGLYNRERLFTILETEVDTPRVVMVADLDRFKPINDTHGHAAGDAVLCAVAERLVDGVRPGDHVARLGGDEFVVLCEDITSDQADTVAHRLLASVSRPIDIGGREVSVGISIGVAAGGTEADMERADAALYEAKGGGRNLVCWADGDRSG